MNAASRGAGTRGATWIPLLSALVILIPLGLARGSFVPLFYFQDEWELLDRWSRDGFGAWVITPFAESPMPVFKLVWAALVKLGGGDYHVILAGLWAVHALNTFLVARLVLATGGGLWAACTAILLCGFAGTNWETLQWSIQLSAVLAITGLLWALTNARISGSGTPTAAALLAAACSCFAALCFARGVAVGPAVAVAVLLTGRPIRDRIFIAAAAMLPSLLIGGWIALQTLGKAAGSDPSAMGDAARYALTTFAQNPTWAFVGGAPPAIPTAALLSLAKLSVFAGALAIAARSRPVLAALLAFEIINAVMLGIGRHHTGIETAASSRYQYASLFMTVPAFVIVMEWLMDRIPSVPRRVVAIVVSGALGVAVLQPWKGTDAGWLAREGKLSRARLEGTAAPGPYPYPLSNVEWIDDARSVDLGREFTLN